MREISIDQTLTQYTGGYYLDKDFLLFDRVGELPFPDESARTTCLLLAICTAGKIEYTVDTKLHEVGPGDIIIVSEGQVVGDYNLSPDCEGVAWMISTDFFQDIVMGIQGLSALFLFARTHPVFHLNSFETKEILNYVVQIKRKILDTGHRFRRELVCTILKVLIYDMSNIIYRVQQREKEDNGRPRGEAIFADFIKLVEKNFRTERRVSWYADELCITHKYLSQTIRSISKRTPSDWIDYYIVLEIRTMLRNSDMSIKEISQAINFPSQSFLGKFFKDKVGVSPTQYRKERG